MSIYYESDLDTFLDNEFKSISLNKRGQPRRRKAKEPRIYFTEDTDDAIIEYLASSDSLHRNKIYRERIEYAFYKLAENIIHTFKFYYTDSDSIEELKHEVIFFIMERLHLFHHSKNINDRLFKFIVKEFNEEYIENSFIEFTGNSITVTQEQIDEFISHLSLTPECMVEISKITPPKAYSYFGTIIKRYLINYNKNNYKKLQVQTGVDDIDEDKNIIYDNVREAEDRADPNTFLDQYIEYVDKYLYSIFPKVRDFKTADAILELFRKRETLEIFNKKALYIYIREITDTSTPQITKITKKLDALRTRLFNEYYQNGYIRM